MNRRQKQMAKEIFKRVARENGVSVDEMRKEIQKSINKAITSTDPTAQNIWREVPRDGDIPTPEEYFIYCVQKLRQ